MTCETKTVWGVKETACFPACWKVYPVNRPESWERNDVENFFTNRASAYAEANRRNDLGVQI